ncbi:MAG: hypothetical protein ACRC06_13075, partial [Waterburya sp.]
MGYPSSLRKKVLSLRAIALFPNHTSIHQRPIYQYAIANPTYNLKLKLATPKSVMPIGKLTAQIILAITIAIAVWGCQVFKSADSANSITRGQCETDRSFVFISSGEFILGSDQQERNFAYNISAQAIAKTTASIKQAEQKLRQAGWFEHENSRQTASLIGYCISRNLVTNREYQQFIQATEHRNPNISEAEYQKQGFLVHPYSKVKSFLWLQ